MQVLAHLAEAALHVHFEHFGVHTVDALLHEVEHRPRVFVVGALDQVAPKRMLGVLPEVLDRIELAGVGTIEHEPLLVPRRRFLHNLCLVHHEVVEEDDRRAASYIGQFIEELHEVVLTDALVLQQDVADVTVPVNGGQCSDGLEALNIRCQAHHISSRCPDAI